MDKKNMEYDKIKTEIKQILKECTTVNFDVVPWFEESNMCSNSMGNPYFEIDESWPVSAKTGKPLHFVFQVFNDNNQRLPKEIGLLQLFVDLDNIPFDDEDEGFLIKTYENPATEKAVNLMDAATEKPEMALWEFEPNVLCAPTWEDVPGELMDRIIDLEAEMEEDELYSDMTYELNCDNAMDSKILGYPGWYQGVSPSISGLKDCTFLLDVHSGLKWCWMGAVYLFWDHTQKKCIYYFQST